MLVTKYHILIAVAESGDTSKMGEWPLGGDVHKDRHEGESDWGMQLRGGRQRRVQQPRHTRRREDEYVQR